MSAVAVPWVDPAGNSAGYQMLHSLSVKVPTDTLSPDSYLSLFRLVKFVSTSVFVSGEPLADLKVIVAILVPIRHFCYKNSLPVTRYS